MQYPARPPGLESVRSDVSICSNFRIQGTSPSLISSSPQEIFDLFLARSPLFLALFYPSS